MHVSLWMLVSVLEYFTVGFRRVDTGISCELDHKEFLVADKGSRATFLSHTLERWLRAVAGG